MTLLKPCIECDQLSDQALCPEHRPTYTKPAAEPYDHQWRKLSELARKMQPWCLWCYTERDLQTDHTPQAWERKAAGLPIRLQDVRVLCGECNRLAGQAKPGPNQRTSEDKPERQNTTGPGRLFTPGAYPQERGVPTRGVRQGSIYSPAGGPAGRLVASW